MMRHQNLSPRPPSSVRSHLYHIPKTGGRSIVIAFGKLIYTDNHGKSYEHGNLSDQDIWRAAIGASSPLLTHTNKGHIHGFDIDMSGTRFLTFGHAPYHDQHNNMAYDENCCSFTVVRDPFARLFSYYKEFIEELRRLKTGEINALSISELAPLSSEFHKNLSFKDFIIALPDNKKLEQLYYFSKEFDVKEAIRNTEKLSAVVICEKNKKGAETISNYIGLNLQIGHYGARSSEYSPSKEEIDYAKRELEPEYEFYENLFKRNS